MMNWRLVITSLCVAFAAFSVQAGDSHVGVATVIYLCNAFFALLLCQYHSTALWLKNLEQQIDPTSIKLASVWRNRFFYLAKMAEFARFCAILAVLRWELSTYNTVAVVLSLMIWWFIFSPHFDDYMWDIPYRQFVRAIPFDDFVGLICSFGVSVGPILSGDFARRIPFTHFARLIPVRECCQALKNCLVSLLHILSISCWFIAHFCLRTILAEIAIFFYFAPSFRIFIQVCTMSTLLRCTFVSCEYQKDLFQIVDPK